MKHTKKILKIDDIFGTGFVGVYIQTTLRKLRDEFGCESFVNSINEKITHEWGFKIINEDDEDGILTIYDWKEYKEIQLDEELKYHIGGKNISKEDILEFLNDNKLGGDYTLQE